MSILIKDLKMPEDGGLLCLRIYPSGVVRTCFSPHLPPDSKIATAIPISDNGNLLPTIEPLMTSDYVITVTDLPPVVYAEQKHGKWIKMSDADGVYWACSECGEDIPRIAHFDPQFDLFPRLESIDKTNYCPNCGAKMERSEE